MNIELIYNAPEKEELDTHDGVIWFPKELMPIPKSEEPFIMKSKNLNLKLKFVNKKMVISKSQTNSEFLSKKSLHLRNYGSKQPNKGGSMSHRNQVFPMTSSLVEIPEH